MLLKDLKDNVINMLNTSNLPIDAIYYVMREIMMEVELTYNKLVQEEQDEMAQARADAERPTTKEEAEKLNKKYAEQSK